jgi:hypothetical protein
MRRFLIALAGVLAVLGSPPTATADETLARTAHPGPVSTFDGRVLWSEYDATAKAYFLTQRFGAATARLPVRPRSVPFDVDVGRKLGNATVAAYSRCRREPRGRDPRTGNALSQMPQWSTGRGCDLYMLNLRTNVETRIRGASSRGASEFLPTVWQSRVVFARVYEHRRGIAGDRAYLYFRWLTRNRASRRLVAGPRGRERFCSGRPQRCRRLVEPGPTTLDLTGRFLGFGWDSTEQGGPSSAVYLEKLRAARIARRLIARGFSGEIQAEELLGPQIDTKGRMVWIRSLFGDSTRSQVERYTVTNGRRDVAPLQPVAGETYVRSIIGSAVDGSTPLYLSSGLFPVTEPCSPQSPCLVEPGCSEAQPCELRTATRLQFTQPPRR